MKKQMVGLCIGVILLFSIPVYAGVPLDTVQANVNKVFEVLRDPKLKAAAAKEIKKKKNFGLSTMACSMKSNYRSAP